MLQGHIIGSRYRGYKVLHPISVDVYSLFVYVANLFFTGMGCKFLSHPGLGLAMQKGQLMTTFVILVNNNHPSEKI